MKDPGLVVRASRASALVLAMVLATMGGAWVGNWLDERLGTSPLLLLLLASGGMAAGFYRILLTLKQPTPPTPDEPHDP